MLDAELTKEQRMAIAIAYLITLCDKLNEMHAEAIRKFTEPGATQDSALAQIKNGEAVWRLAVEDIMRGHA